MDRRYFLTLLVALGAAKVGWELEGIDRWVFLKRLEACGYHRHAISDVAWELYRRGAVPRSAALYYSRLVNSDNLQIDIDCELLEDAK